MSCGNNSISTFQLVNNPGEPAGSEMKHVLPPFLNPNPSQIKLIDFTMEANRFPDHRVQLIYKLVYSDLKGAAEAADNSTKSSQQSKSESIKVISLINVNLILIHYAPQTSDYINLDDIYVEKRKKARTVFTREFRSTSTIHLVLAAFFEEFKARLDARSKFVPVITYSPDGTNNTNAQEITKSMMNKQIGELAKNRENFTLFVNVTNEAPPQKRK